MTSNTDADEAAATEAARAIIAGHGTFPEGLVNAIEQISGKGSVFLPVSNQNMSGPDVETTLEEAASRLGIRVIFTDLPGGSATLAVRRIMRRRPEVMLVTGTNLATLLEFAFQSGSDPAEAARKSVEKGRAALTTFGGT